MITVVDASVAIKWFLFFKPEEDHAGRALKILEEAVSGRLKLYQPPHFVAEMAAVLARVNPQEALLDLRDLLNTEFRPAHPRRHPRHRRPALLRQSAARRTDHPAG